MLTEPNVEKTNNCFFLCLFFYFIIIFHSFFKGWHMVYTFDFKEHMAHVVYVHSAGKVLGNAGIKHLLNIGFD